MNTAPTPTIAPQRARTRRRRRRWLLPREHGAYVQLLVPLLTTLAIAGSNVGAQGLLLGGAFVLSFLAHEPLVVVLGWRGGRLQRELGSRARVQGGMLALLALVCFLAGSAGASQAVFVSLLALVPPACLLAVLLAKRREKTIIGEILVGGLLAAAVVPVGLACGLSIATAVAAAGVWGALAVMATLSVHAIVQRSKHDEHGLAAVSSALALVMAAGGCVLPGLGLPIWTLAVVPGPLVAAVALFAGTSARRLKQVGWSMAAAYTTSALILIATLG